MATRSTFSRADAGMFLLLASVWGFSFLFIKVAVHAVSPLWVVAARTVVGGAFLAGVLALRGRRFPTTTAVWGHLFVLAVIGNVVPWTMVAWAEQSIPSGLAAVINSLVPAMTLAVAAMVGVERMTGWKVAGLVVAMAGTTIVVGGELGSPERLVGVLVVVAATVLFAVGGVYTKRFVSGREAPLSVAAGQVVASAVVSLPLAWIVGPTPAWSELSAAVWGSLGALGALGTGLAFFLLFALIERVGPTYASMVTYLIPVIGLLAGWLVLRERFGWNVLAGAAVIVVGIYLAQREREPAEEELASEPVAA